MLALSVLHLLLHFSNIVTFTLPTCHLIYHTHFPATAIVNTMSMHFHHLVAIAWKVHEITGNNAIHDLPVEVALEIRNNLILSRWTFMVNWQAYY